MLRQERVLWHLQMVTTHTLQSLSRYVPRIFERLERTSPQETPPARSWIRAGSLSKRVSHEQMLSPIVVCQDLLIKKNYRDVPTSDFTYDGVEHDQYLSDAESEERATQ